MVSFALRLLWRILILFIGAAGVFLAVFELFPFVDRRLPTFFALLLVYCGVVYVFIPFLMRLFHLVIKPNHIPLYVATGDGWPSDPVNLAFIVKDRNHLRHAMKSSGWYEADPVGLRSGLRALISIIFNRPYPTSPMSRLYLFNRQHDLAFQIPTGPTKSARTRHHVRFWQLQEPLTETSRHADHYMFWKRQLQHFLGTGREIWVGAATEDTRAIDFQWRTGQLTHGGSHDSDKERDFILQTLDDNDFVQSVHDSEPGEELRFRGQQIRTVYVTDGSLKVARLR